MKQRLTVRGSWILGVVNACENRGVAAEQVLQGTGLVKEDLQGEKSQVNVDQAYKVWDRVEKLIADPGFGIYCGANAHPTVFGAMGMLFMACDSVKQSLHYLERYSYCLSNLGRFSVERQSHYYCLSMNHWAEFATPVRISMSAALACVVKLLRFQTLDIGLVQVSLSCEKPKDPKVFTDYFKCDVLFDQPADFLKFDRRRISTSLVTANRKIVKQLEKQVIEELSLLQRVDLSAQVYSKLCELLPKGLASQERIAREMNMSVRKLQGQLKQERTTYKAIAEYVRQGLAIEYMSDDRISLSEVAYRIGFSNASNFSRTFKRWYGASPSEFRRGSPVA